MEYLMNGDLSHHINNPLPESEVTEIIGQILEGLGHMHDHGFIHRDLKPGVRTNRQIAGGFVS